MEARQFQVRLVWALLKAHGYEVEGITFDLFEIQGLRGVGLLPDGREVSFFIPETSDETAVMIKLLERK